MRIAIFSDLHANLEATEAVFADARRQGCTEFVCLGDVVGYNANPHGCVELVRALNCPVVKGNHDEQATLTESSRTFNQLAEYAINWTRKHLTDEDKAWLRRLPMEERVREFTIVHSSLDEPEQWSYVLNNIDALASFTFQRTSVCFFGHTHVPIAFVRHDGVRALRLDKLSIEPGAKYFINVGSVGQPRDGNWRAAYCIYDLEKQTVELRRIEYDLAKTQEKILKAKLPHLLADRLEVGK